VCTRESFGSVESVKAASDVYLPVNGEVVETNSELTEAPSTVNEDPEGSGWFIKVKVSDEAQLKELMDESAYAKYCKEQEH
jgi:glycine cleavage system H protein